MLGRSLIGGVAALLLSGCQGHLDVAHEADGLLATDRAWAKSATAGNVDSIVANWADDARVAMSGAPLVQRKAAVRGQPSRSGASGDDASGGGAR